MFGNVWGAVGLNRDASGDAQILIFVIQTVILLVIAIVAWLLKRSISNNDAKLEQATNQIKETTAAVSSLQLLIIGDYVKRNEHDKFADHVNKELHILRENIHEARDEIHPLLSRLAVLEKSGGGVERRK